ncbi:MAG: M67 family metallopeptidase [Candidatus Hinthialibacter antarcticus]|nr:M67 family metallopeptidase [Candidatus Hinthialibacter antarcticus]
MQSPVVKVPESVVVPPSFLQKIIDQAEAAAPNECCGVLGGKGSVVTSVYPIENDLCAPDRFNGNPEALFCAVRKMRKANEDMIGVFHSHPSSPPTPSQRDREDNHYPGLFYFIISLASDEPEVRCYVMTDEGEFESVSMI